MKRTRPTTPPATKRARWRVTTAADCFFDAIAAADTCRAHSATRLCGDGRRFAAGDGTSDAPSAAASNTDDDGPLLLLLLAHHHVRSLLTDAEYRYVARLATSAPDLPSGTKGRVPLHSLRVALRRSPAILERVRQRLCTTVPLRRP